jgi:hypothetical protein
MSIASRIEFHQFWPDFTAFAGLLVAGGQQRSRNKVAAIANSQSSSVGFFGPVMSLSDRERYYKPARYRTIKFTISIIRLIQ